MASGMSHADLIHDLLNLRPRKHTLPARVQAHEDKFTCGRFQVILLQTLQPQKRSGRQPDLGEQAVYIFGHVRDVIAIDAQARIPHHEEMHIAANGKSHGCGGTDPCLRHTQVKQTITDSGIHCDQPDLRISYRTLRLQHLA